MSLLPLPWSRRVAAGLLCLIWLGAAPAHAANTDDSDSTELLQVTDPYLELRTGPGRGYPIFFVAPRGDRIVITLRHTDWYKVRTAKGQEGWVQREQLATTLTEAGGQKTFRDVLVDDYLKRRLEAGVAWGRFKAEPMLKLWTSYRLTDNLGVEAAIGQVQGVFSGTDLWHVNVVAEPWADYRLSPFFAVGVGKFKNIPNASLVNATPTDAKLANAAVGVRYHLGERFVLRADYTIYTAFIEDARSTEYRAVTLGVAFFF